MSQEKAKKAAAAAALQFIKSNMTIGLGSGSTSEFFIEELIKKTKSGLTIQTVSSSKRSEALAKKGNILVKNIDEVTNIDLTIDGADEIDPEKKMIKGGGGAHVREKILATSSQKMIVIIDETKQVKTLGERALPVEIIEYGHLHTEKKLNIAGFKGVWRKNTDGSLFITDNNNYIYDVTIKSLTQKPEEIHSQILCVPGVVDTGFFFKVAHTVIVGHPDGSYEIIN
ncbi:MAG: ribose 5-phosphate isomerase A [Chlamydiae bacterium CG10_big_fil_rev_8_21_14_0_10_35_9]|nr:MAG: ribose 5-phosphate isomerase A [Chlamydiae bacterium CG10_big_fil_rev_8_21_14_0_10_35_9]